MLATEQLRDVIGRHAYSSDREKIGQVGQLFLDDQTGQPEFVTVRTGLFGNNESFIPVAEATMTDDGLVVPYEKAKVKDAPHVDAENGHLSQAEEAELYRYYGLSYSETTSDSGLPQGEGTGYRAGVATGDGHDTSGPSTDDAMTRSEEKLHVGAEQHEAGRVRLRKYVETENVTTTVPVRKERAVLEREPVTDADVDQAMSGPAISEEEHEMTLHEETPVVAKHVEPVERVRVGKETVTDEETVSEQVRQERIDVEGDVDER